MTHAEAEALLSRPGTPPCVRLHRRSDGRVITGDCDVGLREAARRQLFRLAGRTAAVFAIALSSLASSGCNRHGVVPRDSKLRQVPGIGRLIEWLDPPSREIMMGELMPSRPIMGKPAAPPPQTPTPPVARPLPYVPAAPPAAPLSGGPAK
jgi:hypothetical protein